MTDAWTTWKQYTHHKQSLRGIIKQWTDQLILNEQKPTMYHDMRSFMGGNLLIIN